MYTYIIIKLQVYMKMCVCVTTFQFSVLEETKYIFNICKTSLSLYLVMCRHNMISYVYCVSGSGLYNYCT